MAAPGVDEETIQQTQELITTKLMESGQLMKMQAMIVEASLKALSAEDPTGEHLFQHTPALKAERKSDDGLAALSLVKDYLTSLGLLYTAGVLELEVGGGVQYKKREELAKKFGVAVDGKTPVLKSVLGAVGVSGPAAAGAVAAAPAVHEKEKKPPTGGASISKEAMSSSVAAVLAKSSQEKPPATTRAGGNAKSKETPYYISNWTGQEFTRIDQVKGQQVAIEDLKDCKVFVFDAADSITMDACENCELVVAACEGSIFIRECKRVKVTAACKQLRFRDTSFCDVYLFASTDPVVEMSHHITFYPFNAQMPRLRERFKEARLDAAQNRFVHIYDFTEDDPSLPKPHYSVKYPDHGGLKMVTYGDKHGNIEAPPEIQQLLEGKVQPAASSESGKNKSHNIKTGGKLWDKSSEEQPAPAPAATSKPTTPAATASSPAQAPGGEKAQPQPAPKAAAVVPPKAAPSSSPQKDSDSYSSFEDDDEF